MASSYSPDLRIELIANGEKSGTWGTITNLNLGVILEDAIAGAATVTTASSAQALTISNGAADQARCSTLVLNTAAAANYSVYVPPVPKLYVVRNTNATYTCTLYASTVAGNTTPAGSGITVPTSTSMIVRCDGTNIVDQTNYISGALGVGGSASVAGNFSVAGTATGVTPAGGDNSTKFATTAFVQSTAGGSFPSGGIIMWSGSIASIPAGWYLCNGSNGTPDLRNRFVIGAAVDSGGVAYTTVTGSNTRIDGTKDAIVVSHTHSLSDPGHNHTLDGIPISNTGNNQSSFNFSSTIQSARYNPGMSTAQTGISISSTGDSGTNANLPPYYALAYIMKA